MAKGHIEICILIEEDEVEEISESGIDADCWDDVLTTFIDEIKTNAHL